MMKSMKSLYNNFRRNKQDRNTIDDDLLFPDESSSAQQTLLVNDYLSSGGRVDEYDNPLGNNSNDTSTSNEARGRSRKAKYFISSRVMNILGNIFAVVTLLAFLIVVPWITAHAMIFDKARPDFAAFYSAGAFVLITVAMSTKLIYNHFTHWYMPDVQKYVVRILWMVPIYSVQSWLSLRFHNARIYIDTLRDLYEAYVIQSFLYYLMELLGELGKMQ